MIPTPVRPLLFMYARFTFSDVYLHTAENSAVYGTVFNMSANVESLDYRPASSYSPIVHPFYYCTGSLYLK